MLTSIVPLVSFLLFLVAPSYQQDGQSLYFFMEPAIMEAPLVSGNSVAYPRGLIDPDLYVESNTLLPGASGPGQLIALATNYAVAYTNQSAYLINHDLATGATKYFRIEDLGRPSFAAVAVANPSTQEIITVTTTSTTNLTFFNPTSGTHRQVPLVVVSSYMRTALSMQLDIKNQIVYVLVGSSYGFLPVVIQTYDAKSGEHLNSYNISHSYGNQMVSILLDQTTGTLYGIETANLNTTYIVEIDIVKHTTTLVAPILGKFYSVNWWYQPVSSLFYAIFAGQVWTVTQGGHTTPLSLTPADNMYCTRGIWSLGPSTKKASVQQLVPELFYIFKVGYTDAYIDLNFAMQLISHTVSQSSLPTSINLLKLSTVQPVYGYATTGITSCFPATSSYLIQMAYGLTGQFLNFISFVKQVKLLKDNPQFYRYDDKMAWNPKTNTTILAATYYVSANASWQMPIFEIDSFAPNPFPQVKFSLSDYAPLAWSFDSLSQTIFGFNTLNASQLISVQYPSGRINWKLDITMYYMWTDDEYGIAIDELNSRLFLITCDNPVNSCFSNEGPRSIVEIRYTATSAVVHSVSEIGVYGYAYNNVITTMMYSHSLGGVVIGTQPQLYFFDPNSKQLNTVGLFRPSCANCVVLRDA